MSEKPRSAHGRVFQGCLVSETTHSAHERVCRGCLVSETASSAHGMGLPRLSRERDCAFCVRKGLPLCFRATERRGSVAQVCRAVLLGDDIGLKCCLRWGCGITSWYSTVVTRRGTAPLGRTVGLNRGFYLMWLYHVEGGEEAAVGGGFLVE